jgi:hypothetical protein
VTLDSSIANLIKTELLFQKALNLVESRRHRPRDFVTPCEVIDEVDATRINFRIRNIKMHKHSGGRFARKR